MSTRPIHARHIHARGAFLVLFLAAAGMLIPSSSQADHHEDAKANEVAAKVMKAMGGQQAWDDTRFITFSFAGFRTHHWDKHTGRHRLEFTDREGHHNLVLHNVVDREGRAWRDGVALEGEELKEAMNGAYGAWINDTYWLVMPYKLRDPGVNLSHAGEETIDGVKYTKLHLTFGDVGLTPGDQYWAYIHPETHLMDRWAYHLESYEEDREPTMWIWSGWAPHGDIMLAPGRVNTSNDRELPLADIAVVDSMPDSVFESNEKVVQ